MKMDSPDEEDLFALSDDETAQETSTRHNPIEENLMNQLNEVQEQIRRAKNEVTETEILTDKILDKLNMKCLCLDDESSDSNSELYSETGEPIAKRKCKKKVRKVPPLDVSEVWQRIIDDKWVIGVDLANHSNQILSEPNIFVNLKGQNELSGFTSFWEMETDSPWNKTNELRPDCERITAIVVLDLPSFQNSSFVEVFGTIAFVMNGRDLQVPIRTFKLEASQAVHKSFTPKYASGQEESILAIKAASIQKTFSISLICGVRQGERLLSVLEANKFNETFPDIYVSKESESFRHCLLEIIIPEAQNEVQVRIFARSTSQLNAVMHMLRAEFPDMKETSRQDKILEAAFALERELELRLETDNSRELSIAQVTTDFFIP